MNDAARTTSDAPRGLPYGTVPASVRRALEDAAKAITYAGERLARDPKIDAARERMHPKDRAELEGIFAIMGDTWRRCARLCLESREADG